MHYMNIFTPSAAVANYSIVCINLGDCTMQCGEIPFAMLGEKGKTHYISVLSGPSSHKDDFQKAPHKGFKEWGFICLHTCKVIIDISPLSYSTLISSPSKCISSHWTPCTDMQTGWLHHMMYAYLHSQIKISKQYMIQSRDYRCLLFSTCVCVCVCVCGMHVCHEDLKSVPGWPRKVGAKISKEKW